MGTYQKRKAAAREEAIRWQADFPEQDISWGELASAGDYFTKLARRYGLVREFRENGII